MMIKSIAISLACLMAAAAPAVASYGIGTSGQGTITYGAGAAVAKVASEKAKLDIRVQPYGGSSQYVPLVGTKEIDFGLANILEVESAYNGTLIFDGRRTESLRVVAVIFPLYSGYYVRADSPVRSMEELKGKRIPVGYTSQAIIAPVSEAILATSGLASSDFKGVPVPNLIRAADDFAEGKTDAFYFGIGAGKVTQVAASVNGLRLLPVKDTPEAMAAARKLMPQAYITKLSPSPKNVGVVEPTNVFTYDYLLFAGGHVADDVVYQVTKALYENKKDLAAATPVFSNMDQKRMGTDLGVPFHPGAIRFYKEIGLWKE